MSTPTTGTDTRERVKTMLAAGLNPRQIAKALDLSTQRVYQIKNILKAIEEDERGQAS